MREAATGKLLPDVLDWTKARGVAWQVDVFYYSRFELWQAGHPDFQPAAAVK